MRCSKCGSNNPAGKKFCEDCGAPLVNPCPRCGAETTAGKGFCGECGAPLAATSVNVEPRASTPTGERRHLTVLFCDLVGSTEIAAQLDPEEWREFVAGYHRAAAEAITRFGGHVAKYLGDGVMAYFGYPEARENDAERAARAGLAILEGVAKLNQQSTNPKLSARVGIDSGTVVVGAGASNDTDVFGEAPNNAARAQALAAPGTVLFTAATDRLVAGLFVVEDRGMQALKGTDRPLQIYRVIQPSGVRGRLEAVAATRGLTPFIGREEELRLLLNRWERVLDGEGQAAVIIGEAGIGKSRLLQHFHQQILSTPHTWIEAAATPSSQNTPFYPIAEMLRQFGAPRGDEPGSHQLEQLEPQLTTAGLNPTEVIPLIAPILNLPVPVKYPPLAYSPEQRRRRLLATLVEWVLGAARIQPLVIATEDVHWADASTLELIQLLVEQGATGRVLLLYTARPEFRPQWPLRAHHSQITLNRLSARTVRMMVEQVAARRALSDETVAGVVERTGGVPLFVEELTRALLESGQGELGAREIPVTLHDSLMTRLDRLGAAKEVAQIGSVIGGQFSYELISAVCPMAENELREALRTLTDADLLYVRGIAPEATYQFKHALIRDAAYEALLKTRRKELHRQVASTIEEKFAALKETHPELLARHWTEADEIEHAIAEWERAGKLAEGRNAFVEALENCRQALALLSSLPESPERDLRELPLRESIYAMLGMVRGSNARETMDAADHAISLARRTNKIAQLAYLVSTRAYGVFTSGDVNAAAVLADQALDLAFSEGTHSTILQAEAVQILIHYHRGDLAGAEAHFASGLKSVASALDDISSITAALFFGVASFNAWFIGRPDAARERLAQMRTVAKANKPVERAAEEMFAAMVHVLLREYRQAEASAAIALELSDNHQYSTFAGISRIHLGHARVESGRVSEGSVLMCRGIEGLLQIGMHPGLSRWILFLATAQQSSGQLIDALETVERALRFNPDALIYRPEGLRVRGEIRLKLGEIDGAKADFNEAIALARTMGAKAWELRSTMSLARLLRDTRSREEARSMLADIYNWFTEGFDTADLKDAKALLDELTA